MAYREGWWGWSDQRPAKTSDANKDLELKAKAKDRCHKAKAKAKDLGYQGQGQALRFQDHIKPTCNVNI